MLTKKMASTSSSWSSWTARPSSISSKANPCRWNRCLILGSKSPIGSLARIPASEVHCQLLLHLEEIISKAIGADRQLRYQSAAEMRADLQRLKRDTVSGSVSATRSASRVAASTPGTVVPALPVTFFRLKWIAPTVVILLILGGLVLRQKFFLRPPVQHGPVSLLLTDFNNTTLDPVFNGPLQPIPASPLN